MPIFTFWTDIKLAHPCASAHRFSCVYIRVASPSAVIQALHHPDPTSRSLPSHITFTSLADLADRLAALSVLYHSVILDPSQSYRQVLARGTAASHLIIQGTFALLHVDTNSLDNFTHNSVICAPFLTFLGSEWSYCSAHPSYGHVLSKHIVSVHKSIPIPLTPQDIIFASPSTSRVPYAVVFHLEHDSG